MLGKCLFNCSSINTTSSRRCFFSTSTVVAVRVVERQQLVLVLLHLQFAHLPHLFIEIKL